MQKISVLLADDHTILREGLRTILQQEEDIQVVGEAETGKEAIHLAGTLHPDVVLMDIAMPEMNGIEATAEIRKRHPNTKVLILTMHDNEEYLFRLLKHGASGYILKKTAATELVSAIRTAYEGHSYLSPLMTQKLVDDHLRLMEKKKGKVGNLTQREQEIVKLIAEGHTNQEMANILTLSIKTVQTHRAHVMEKLGLHDRGDLIKYAIQKGIIHLGESPLT